MRPRIYIVVIVTAILTLGGLLYLGPLDDAGKIDAICLAFVGQGQQNRIPIVAEGEFISYNEGLAYIGDTVSFELAVAYNPDRVNVIDDELLQFNVAPFTLLDKGPVRTAVFDGCTVKRLRFVIRVIGVQIGERNAFWFRSLDDILRRPSVPYTIDGARKYSSVTYDELFVVSLTRGEIIQPRDIPKVVLEEPQDEGKDALALTLIVLGSLLISASAIVAMVWRSRDKRRKILALAAKPDILRLLFPGLFWKDDPRKALTSVYFSLDICLERANESDLRATLEECKLRASVVFECEDNKKFTEVQSCILNLLKTRRFTLEAEEGEKHD